MLTVARDADAAFGWVTRSRRCGSDARLRNRLDRARSRRSQHFENAAYNPDTVLWFRWKRVRGEIGSVRAHLLPDGTVGHMSGAGHAGQALSDRSRRLPYFTIHQITFGVKPLPNTLPA